jgi:tripartite-type tricarboxylate transporter receptor subunit TctC
VISCRLRGERTKWRRAPKNTPRENINKLNVAINAAFAHPTTTARVADLGGTVLSGSPDDFGKLITEEN